MIYFIQEGNYGNVKIGHTDRDVYERIKEFETGNSSELKLIIQIYGDKNLEKELHYKFEKYRVKGEWFEYSSEIKEYIVNLLKGNVDSAKQQLKNYLNTIKKDIIENDEWVYEGDVFENEPHGEGLIRYSDGSWYEGSFEDGEFSGWGIYCDSKGNKTETDWRYGEESENDTVYKTYVNGDEYEGEIIHGEFSFGVYKWSTGAVYDGHWADNLRNGEGKMVYPEGDVYTGNWKDGFPHGYGEKIFVDGSKYFGNWEKGEMHGKGKLIFKENDYYEGEFSFQKFNGFGSRFYSNGDRYNGNWKNNKKNGYGDLIESNGNKYSGNWLDDLKEGDGKFVLSFGIVQEGKWKNDKLFSGYEYNKYGKVDFTYKDGKQYTPLIRVITDFFN